MSVMLYISAVYILGLYFVANVSWAIVIQEHFGWNYDNFNGFTEKFICPLYLFIGTLIRRRTPCSVSNTLLCVI